MTDRATVSVDYAEAHLSDLLDRAEAGEDVVIARANRPAIRLVPEQSSVLPGRGYGILKGKIPDMPFERFVSSDEELKELGFDL